MMFENISNLYTQYRKYINGEPYIFLHSNLEIENWAESKVMHIEEHFLTKSWQELDREFFSETGGLTTTEQTKTNHLNLLSALNSAYNFKDVEAVF
jgi:hypothetical protein